jgi:NADPH2:quinone reductase
MFPTGHRVTVAAFGETPLEALDQHLAIEAMEPPDPKALGPNDVLVEVRSASVGWVDLLMMSGQYQHIPKPPYTPGLEYAGVVLWCGEAASKRVAVGDRVLSDGLLTGPRSLGDHQRWGGFASYDKRPWRRPIAHCRRPRLWAPSLRSARGLRLFQLS